jgi:hypothetical protein
VDITQGGQRLVTLLANMLKADISRFHPDPIAALDAVKYGEGRLGLNSLLSGVKRTYPFALHMSAFDPRTSMFEPHSSGTSAMKSTPNFSTPTVASTPRQISQFNRKGGALFRAESA